MDVDMQEIPYASEELVFLTPEEAMRLQYDQRDYVESRRHLRNPSLRMEGYYRVRGRMSTHQPVDPVYVEIMGEGHIGKEPEPEVLRTNGQHRTAAAYDLGIRQIPVVIRKVTE
jgi:hypothetical protein